MIGAVTVVVAAVIALAVLPAASGVGGADRTTASPGVGAPRPVTAGEGAAGADGDGAEHDSHEADGRVPVSSPAPGPAPTAARSDPGQADRTGPVPLAPADLPPEEAGRRLVAALKECGAPTGVVPDAEACVAAATTVDSPLRLLPGGARSALPEAGAVEVSVVGRDGAAVMLRLVTASPAAPSTAGSTPSTPGPTPGTTTASALMIRTEAGWSIRDVFPAD